MLRNIILASVAAAGFVNAASVCDSDVTITTATDITSIASCSVISGNVNIEPGLGTITLPALERIGGDFVVTGTMLTSLSAPLLAAISGTFNMTDLTILSTCSMPVLQSVGSIYWQTLPALSELSFNLGVTTADNLYISDTYLSSLAGVSLLTVGTFDVNNNKNLLDVTVQLKNVTTALNVEFNGKSVNASFPNLVWALNATFRDCGSVSMPSLTTINSSLALDNNTFTSFEAYNLTSVGQSLSFLGDDSMTNVSFPNLVSVGGTLRLANNTDLLVIDGFPKLKLVKGSIDLSGDFTNVSLPSLATVNGGLNVQTSAMFDCTAINALKGNVVQGDTFVCDGAVSNPGTEGTTPSTTTSAGSTATHKSAAGRVSVSSFGLFAAIAFIGALTL